MTTKLKLYDSVTGDIPFKALDRRKDQSRNRAEGWKAREKLDNAMLCPGIF